MNEELQRDMEGLSLEHAQENESVLTRRIKDATRSTWHAFRLCITYP